MPSASLLVAAALLSLVSLAALPPFVLVAAEEPAQATAAAQLPTSRKRPRATAERQERRRALGDLSHILSARTHPHPEPTSSPSAGPPFYGGESDGGGELPQMMPPPPAPTTGEEDSEVPQPRNERPWDEEEEEVELGDFTKSTDSDDTKGRGEDNKLVPPDDGDGTTDLDLLEKLDEDDDDTDDPNNNADDKDEVIDVSPVEPSPAPTTAALPVTDDPTGSPTRAPTRAPTQRPSPGEFS